MLSIVGLLVLLVVGAAPHRFGRASCLVLLVSLLCASLWITAAVAFHVARDTRRISESKQQVATACVVATFEQRGRTVFVIDTDPPDGFVPGPDAPHVISGHPDLDVVDELSSRDAYGKIIIRDLARIRKAGATYFVLSTAGVIPAAFVLTGRIRQIGRQAHEPPVS